MSPRIPLYRISVLVLGAVLFLTPLAHSGALSDPFGLPKQIVALGGSLILLLAAVLEVLSRGPGPRLRSVALFLAAAFVLSAAVAAALSPTRALALDGLGESAALVIVAWAAARALREPRDAAWLLRSALAGAAVVAAGTVAQVFWPGTGLSLAGLSLLPPATAGATLGDPGLAAQFLLLALPLGIGAASLSPGRARPLCGLAIGLVLAALVLASRPEGWVAGSGVAALLLITGAVRGARSGRGLRGLIPDPAGGALGAATAALTVLLVILALPHVPRLAPAGDPVAPLDAGSLLAPTTGDAQADRAAAVRGSQALLALHPLGSGLSTWRHAFLEVAWSRDASSPFDLGHQAVHAGNSFVELAAETGVPGGIVFVSLFLLLLVQAARSALLDPGPWGTVGFASLNALLAAGLVAFFGSPFQETTPALLFWTVTGATQAALLRGDRPAAARRLGVAERPARPAGPGMRRAAWVALALWAVPAAGAILWTADRVDAGRRTLAARSLMRTGDLARAIELLDAASIRRSPDHLPHVLRADALLRGGRPREAIEAFSDTLLRSPWFPAAYMGRAAAREEQGRYDLADEDLRRALAIWPDAPDILLRRARLDARRGRLEASLEGYRRLTRISPKMADPWCGMAEIYLRLARYDAALECYLTCANRNPGFPRVNLGLGEAYERRGLDEMALNYYKRAAGADETSVEPRLRLANLYDRMGQACNARDSLIAARDLETDPPRRATILDLIDKVDPACRAEQRRQP